MDKQTDTIVENLVSLYEKNPVIKGLIQFIPIASAIDAALSTRLQNIREERTKSFFDELAKGNTELKPELLENEDFLHCFLITIKAAVNSRRREKIRIFARLLKSSVLDDSFSDTDEYEEYLGILDELSYRELQALLILDKYESKFPKGAEENDLQRAMRFWEQFTKELEKALAVPQDEVGGFLTRLNRTGCYETFVGGNWGYEGGKGRLTRRYFRLKELTERDYGTSV